MIIPKAEAGGPQVFKSAAGWNALRGAALNQQTLGNRTEPHRPGFVFRCLNTTGEVVPKGGVLGIDRSQALIDFDGPTVESRFLAQPGCVGVVPQITTSCDDSEIDHRLDWVIALRDMHPDSVAPVCVAGFAWVKVDVLDEHHMFVSPAHDEYEFAQTCSGGLARILQLAPAGAADGAGKRWAKVVLDPTATIELEGYMEDGVTASGNALALTAGSARVRLRERRGNQWVRLDEYVRVVNPYTNLVLGPKTFVAVRSWDRSGWRINRASCNVSIVADKTTTYAEVSS